MNTKKIFYGLFTCLILMAAACTTTDTAEEDKLYEVGIDKDKIKLPTNSIDKDKIKLPTNSIDKDKIKLPRSNS